MNLAEFEFTEDDKNLFVIDDLQLKADAIKYSVLPRLNGLVYEAISLIRNIYGIEVLADNHISQSPNFRSQSNRKNELAVNYEWAIARITGKRVKNKWHGLIKKDGKHAQIMPIEYGFVLTENGLSIELYNSHLKTLSKDSYSKIFSFNLEHSELIQSLCLYLSINIPRYIHVLQNPIIPLSEYWKLLIEKNIFDIYEVFSTTPIEFPIREEKLNKILETFVLFYPVYDSYLKICMGKKVEFKMLIEKLNDWINCMGEQESDDDVQENSDFTHNLDDIKKLADTRVRVMPAIRWQVFQRDNWKCVACGKSASDDVILHVDHIVPRSKGGADSLENYQTLCHLCNIGKSNKDDTNLRKR